jgi:hypothetical protein
MHLMQSQYLILLFNKIPWLCGPQPRGDDPSNGDCNSGSTGHDFLDNVNIYFLFFYHENRTLLKIWEPIQFSDWMPSENPQSGSHDSFSLAGSHWELDWKLAPVFIWGVRTAQNWCEPHRSDQLSAQWNYASKFQDDVSTVQHHVTLL